MNSSWVLLLIVQSLLIRMELTNATSTASESLDDFVGEDISKGSWEAFSFRKEEGTSDDDVEAPSDLMMIPTEQPFLDTEHQAWVEHTLPSYQINQDETVTHAGEQTFEEFEPSDEMSHYNYKSTRRPEVNPSNPEPFLEYTDGYLPPFEPPSSSSHWITDLSRDINPHTEINQYDSTFSRPIPSLHDSSSLPDYYNDNPTKVVVQFAVLRKDIANRLRAMQIRSNQIDTRVTDLIKGSFANILQDNEKNNQLITEETEKRVAALKRVYRFAQDQIRSVKEEIDEIHSKVNSIRQTVNANRVRCESALQNYGAAANREIQELKKELNRHFIMITGLQKQSSDDN